MNEPPLSDDELKELRHHEHGREKNGNGGNGRAVGAWFRDKSAILVYLTAQTVAAIIWGATMSHRVDVIEARGSPQVAALELSISSLKAWQNEHDKRAAETHLTSRLAEHERRLALVEDHDRATIDILKQINVTLGRINDDLTRHLINGREKEK